MNTIELEKMLIKLGIPRDAYKLSGGHPNEAFCIGNNGDGWETYYSERGSKTGKMTFESENEACEYFLKWMKITFKK